MKKFTLMAAMFAVLLAFLSNSSYGQELEVSAFSGSHSTLLYSFDSTNIDEPVALDLYDEQGFVETVVMDSMGLAESSFSQLLIADVYGTESGASLGTVIIGSDSDEEEMESTDLYDLPDAVQQRILEIQGPGFEVHHPHDFGTFDNDEGLLPEDGDYTEIYVTGQTGDSRRLVFERGSGTLYYTSDHYESFEEVENPWTLTDPSQLPF